MSDPDEQMDAKIDMIVHYMPLKKLNAYYLAGMLQAAQSETAVRTGALTCAAAQRIIRKRGNHIAVDLKLLLRNCY